MSYDSNISNEGGKDGIGRQIVLPFHKAFQIAWKSIRIRIWRSLITTSGIILAIAFLMSVWTSGAFTDRLREVSESNPLHDVVQQALREQALSQGKIDIRIGILGGSNMGEAGNSLDLIMRDRLQKNRIFKTSLMPNKIKQLRDVLQPEEEDKGIDTLVLLSLPPKLASADALTLLMKYASNGGNILILGHNNILPGDAPARLAEKFQNILPAQPQSTTIMVGASKLRKSEHSAVQKISAQNQPELMFVKTSKKPNATSLAGTQDAGVIWMTQREDGTVFWLPISSKELTQPDTIRWLFQGNVMSNILEWASREKLQKDLSGKRKLWLVSLSLLVCIVGITNAMLMSVTERFREIGTMKCLGALDRFVVRLFLIESSFQGAVGSIVGAFVGFGLATARTLFAYRITDAATGKTYWLALEFFPVSRILMWLGVSIVVGICLSVFAAIYPAYRAARMEPVDAMRTEA